MNTADLPLDLPARLPHMPSSIPLVIHNSLQIHLYLHKCTLEYTLSHRYTHMHGWHSRACRWFLGCVPLVRIAFPCIVGSFRCAIESVCHRISGRISTSVSSSISIKTSPPPPGVSALSLVISSPDFRYTFSSGFI